MITALTIEQEAKLPYYRDKWLKIGLKTGECDQAKAEYWVDKVYEEAGLTPPKVKIWLDSPLQGVSEAYRLRSTEDQVRYQVWDQIRNQIRRQILDQVSNQIDYQIWNQIRNQAWYYAVGYTGYGTQDADFFSDYDFLLNELKLEGLDKIVPLMNLSQNCGWWFPFEKTVIFTKLPTEIHRDEEYKLHHFDKPALVYPDGFGVYTIHGVRVPEKYILKPAEDIDIKELFQETNVEIRMLVLKKVGLDRALSCLDTRSLDKKDSYELLGIKFTDRYCEYLKMVNPSTGEVHVEGVAPGIKTVKEALAWRAGLKVYSNPSFQS